MSSHPSGFIRMPSQASLAPSHLEKALPSLPTTPFPSRRRPTTLSMPLKEQLTAFYRKNRILVLCILAFLVLIIIVLISLGASGKLHKLASDPSSSSSGGEGKPTSLTGSGDGTYYSPGQGLGSCGETHQDTEMVAALNAPQYGSFANPNASPVCGACVVVTGPKGTVKVKIVDRCPVCKSGDLDLSPAAFNRIADPAQGRVRVTWKGC